MSMKRFLLSTSCVLLIVKKAVCLLTVPVATTGICAGNPCHNGGTCIPDVTSPYGVDCICAGEFSGSLCDTPCSCRLPLVWTDWMVKSMGRCSAACGHGYMRMVKDCLPLNPPRSAITQTGCMKYRPCWESCPGIECYRNPCENSGTCVQHPDGYSCSCENPYQGANCAQYDYCYSNPCANGGTCVTQRAVHGYRCTCTGGWQGWECLRYNQCYNNPCANGGTCIDQVTSYYCACTNRWRGNQCMQIAANHCDSNPCARGGVCVDLHNSTYICVCLEHWTGNRCQQSEDCESNPCLNNGTCIQHTNGHSCDCSGAYLGPSCTHDDNCYSNPCANGGTCENQATSYNCSCADGWQGDQCQQYDNCYSNPCANGGTCENQATSYNCSCADGWQGDQCQQCMAITRDSLGVNVSIDNDETTTHIDGSTSEVSFWSSWSSPVCSVTCGDGIAQKARVCAAIGACQGPATITHICKRESCGVITDIPKTGSIAWSIFAILFLVVIIIVSIGVLTMYLLLSRRAPTEEEGRIIKIMRGVFRLQRDDEEGFDEPSRDSTYMSGENGMEDDENVSETKVKEEEDNQEVAAEEDNQEVAAEATTVLTDSSE